MMRDNIYRCLWLALLIAVPVISRAETVKWRGDINGDGKITIRDLTAMVAQLRSSTPTATALSAQPALDVNADGKFDFSDVQALASVMLGKSAPQQLPTKGGFSDGDMSNPSTGNSNGGFSDNDQQNPNTDGGSGGFKDDDMKNPE